MTTETGKVIRILPIQSGNGNEKEWQRKTIIVENENQYPEKVPFDLWNDKCKIEINIGDRVTIEGQASGREYTEKWYTSIKATKVTVLSKAAAPIKNEKPTFETADFPETNEAKDDLPF